jgi:hypothetical protein
VDERLRVQLWDSDRFTADDDLGRIEVDLKHLMKSEETNGTMHKRCDGFRALKKGQEMPGKLEWQVGYFSKTRIQDCQLKAQTYDPEIRTMAQLRESVDTACANKLREASIKERDSDRDKRELEQQRAQELKATQDNMIISAPPPEDYPSGILSLVVHNITGLELEKLSKEDSSSDLPDQEEETGDTLPSSYCNLIINHRKVFKTRTKPQNAKPFFNAGTERFIADWQNAEVHIGVRDARVHEDDPLLGIVHLNLAELFKHRSQINSFFPLTGGVGFGRVRLSLVWRSVQLQAPPEAIGWELGTLEVKPKIEPSSDLPDGLGDMRLKLSTNIGSAKMYPSKKHAGWSAPRHRAHWLAVEKRYSTCLSIRFRNKKVLGGNNAAFGVFWLKDVPDEEEREIEIPVWKGDFRRAVACSLDECGEKVGSIKLKIRFWSGLGEAHSKWASGNPDLRNVMEVLETARDNLDEEEAEAEAGVVRNEGDDKNYEHGASDVDDSSTDDDDDNDDDDESNRRRPVSGHAKENDGHNAYNDDSNNNDKYSQGMVEHYRSRRRDAKVEHRRHRGVMQFKVSSCPPPPSLIYLFGLFIYSEFVAWTTYADIYQQIPRTARWAMHKGERVQDKIESIFKHHTREPGVETEV